MSVILPFSAHPAGHRRGRQRTAVGFALAVALAPVSSLDAQASPQAAPDDTSKAGMTAKNRGDLASARVLFGQACQKGQPFGCYNLGNMLRDGEGGPVDLNGARSAYLRACDAGHAAGCSELGTMLATAQGRPSDRPGAGSARMARNPAGTLTPILVDDAAIASDLAALKSGLMKLAANPAGQTRGLAGSTQPRTWHADASPRPMQLANVRSSVCSVATNRDFDQRGNQTSLTYGSSLEGTFLTYTPWRGRPLFPKIVPVLLQHSAGLNEVVFMEWRGGTMTMALDPRQDRMIREAMSQPGIFQFTHDEITRFDVSNASEQLAALGACEARLRPEPAPVSIAGNLANLDRLIQNRQWDDALRAVLGASKIEKRRFLLKFHEASIADSRHAPAIALLRQNMRIFDQAIYGSSGAERSTLQVVKADFERYMNPRSPSASPREGDWGTFVDGMRKATASTTRQCTDAGGKVTTIGSVKWCD